VSELVRVWIMGDEYECPEHYQWTEGPLSDSYRNWLRMVPAEQVKRWREIRDLFEEMNREMKVFFQAQPPARHSAKGLPW